MADPSFKRPPVVPFGLAAQKPRTGLIETKVSPQLMEDKEKFANTLNDIFMRLDSTLNTLGDRVGYLDAAGRASTCIVLPDMKISLAKEKENYAPMVTPFPLNITTPIPVAAIFLTSCIDLLSTGNAGQYGTTLVAPFAHIVPVPGPVPGPPSQLPGDLPREAQQWQVTFINGLRLSRQYLLRFVGVRFATPPNPINGRVNLVVNGSTGV